MGIMSSVTGNAGPLGLGAAHDEFGRLLGPGEQLFAAFEFVRDVMLFTNGRLILVDKQGVTAHKVEYHSIPYRSISHFAVQTAGHLDTDAEMYIWLEGENKPIEKQFNRHVDIYQVQGILSAFVVAAR
jgi:PH (Pleckstrin Homology) domain-containing protein